MTSDKIIHYVPGNWGGKAILTAVCGARVIYTYASSATTNCPECRQHKEDALDLKVACAAEKETDTISWDKLKSELNLP